MLEETNNNDELQQYLAEKSYDTASLGETSADELAVQASSASEDHNIDVFRSDDQVSKNYEEASKLSSAIKDYEHEVLADHLNLDIYRAIGKDKNKISFKDLTLQQNLNYIKYTMKDTNEAYEFFKITQDNFGEYTADIPAALVQKIATRTRNLDNKDTWQKIVDRPEYKMMLKAVKKGMVNLSNRHFVDTLFSIGKMHRNQLPEETAQPLYPFMNYLIGDFLKESKTRLLQFQDPMELAHLVKGFTSLDKLVKMDTNTEQFEIEFRAELLSHLNKDHALLARFDPYATSKLLRYLLRYNDSSVDAIEIFKSLSLLLVQTIASREASLLNATINDPLIDLDVKDVVDIIRIYSTFAQLG